MRKPIRLVVCDVDGTLLNSRHELTSRTTTALRRAMAAGIQIVVATGKTYLSAVKIIRQLGLVSPGVYVQGLVICDADGSVLHSQALKPEVVRKVAAFIEAQKLVIVGYSRARILTNAFNHLTNALMRYDEPQPEKSEPLNRIAGSVEINKLIVACEEERMAALRQALNQHLNGSATLVQSLPSILEVLPVGASKGAGLTWLLHYLNVSPGEVLAIGDAENDVEMLRMVGIGAAVANAMPQAKDAADVVVASNDEDGVAEAVERFVLHDAAP